MTLVTHTISGIGYAPDGETPLVGTWYCELVSDTGVVLDHDEDGFRAGVASCGTDNRGWFSWDLPATHQLNSEPMDYYYRIWFISLKGEVRLSKQYIELLGDCTIDEVLQAPTVVPVTASMVTEAQMAETSARAAATAAALSADQAHGWANLATDGLSEAISGLDTRVTVIENDIDMPSLVVLFENRLV